MTSTSRILKAALAAITNIEAIRAIVSQQDQAEFPEFALLMQTAGNDLDWKAYKATSADGYITNLLRITGQNQRNGSVREAPRGPILLQHGMYSDCNSWMERSDASSPAMPVKLFELGFDVWIACARGTYLSQEHTTWDWQVDSQYYDYCFFDEGLNDLPAQVDTIIAARDNDACGKVAVLTHSTASNMALYGTCENLIMQEKISRLITLAPCYFLNLDTLEINFNERPSQMYFFDLLKKNNITTLFGPKFESDVRTTICLDPAYENLCQYLLMVNEQVADYSGNQSAKNFAHLAQIAVEQRWQEFIPVPDMYPQSMTSSELVGIDQMAGPDVYAIFAGGDSRCPVPKNDALTSSILSHMGSVNIAGAEHMGFLGANDNAFMGVLDPYLPTQTDLIVNTAEYCPVSKKQKSGSDKSESNKSEKSASEKSEKAKSEKSVSEKSEKSAKTASDKSNQVKSEKSESVKSEKEKSDKAKSEKTASDKDSNKSNGSNKSDKSNKSQKKIRKTKYIGLQSTQGEAGSSPAFNLDAIDLNVFDVDFDDDGYSSEVQVAKEVNQLQGVYSTGGRQVGDSSRAEKERKRREKQQQYFYSRDLPKIQMHFDD